VEDLDLPHPKIVVVGDQSTGKSSLIEGMSEIKVLRSAGTCNNPMNAQDPSMIKIKLLALKTPSSFLGIDKTILDSIFHGSSTAYQAEIHAVVTYCQLISDVP